MKSRLSAKRCLPLCCSVGKIHCWASNAAFFIANKWPGGLGKDCDIGNLGELETGVCLELVLCLWGLTTQGCFAPFSAIVSSDFQRSTVGLWSAAVLGLCGDNGGL